MVPFYALLLGWSLHRRRLGEVEVCESSCDAGHNANCDAADEEGEFTLSCDEHPTTSCDEDCHYSPPPPLAPWLENGTYPSPPPGPPPPSEHSTAPLLLGLFVLTVALVVLLCVLCLWCYKSRGPGSARARLASDLCCCGSFFRGREEEEHSSDSGQRHDEDCREYSTVHVWL